MTVTKRSCLWCYFMQHLSILTTGKATARRSLRCYCGNTPKGNYGFIISQMKEIINSPISSNMCLSCILPIIHLKLECSTHIRWPFWPIGNTVLNSFQLCLSAIWCQAGSVWCAFCCCFFLELLCWRQLLRLETGLMRARGENLNSKFVVRKKKTKNEDANLFHRGGNSGARC